MSDWIDLGGLEFQVISGGRFRLDGGAMFGIIPRNLWEREHSPDEQNRIDLETNCVVVRTAGQVILIDTGNGDKFSEKDRQIFAVENGVTVADSLAGAGIAPEEVDMVILSHLHLDHVGGASRYDGSGNEILTFPRARHIVRSGEWADAVANRSTMRVSYRKENLRPLEASGRLELLDSDSEVAPGIGIEARPGHTPYHQVVHLNGWNGHAVYASDLLATWSHIRPPYNAAFDQEPYVNMVQKMQLLEDAAREGWRLVTSHDPRVPVGRVEQTGTLKFRVLEE